MFHFHHHITFWVIPSFMILTQNRIFCTSAPGRWRWSFLPELFHTYHCHIPRHILLFLHFFQHIHWLTDWVLAHIVSWHRNATLLWVLSSWIKFWVTSSIFTIISSSWIESILHTMVGFDVLAMLHMFSVINAYTGWKPSHITIPFRSL